MIKSQLLGSAAYRTLALTQNSKIEPPLSPWTREGQKKAKLARSLSAQPVAVSRTALSRLFAREIIVRHVSPDGQRQQP